MVDVCQAENYGFGEWLPLTRPRGTWDFTERGCSPGLVLFGDSSGHGTMVFHTQHGETLSFSFVLASASHAVVTARGQCANRLAKR